MPPVPWLASVLEICGIRGFVLRILGSARQVPMKPFRSWKPLPPQDLNSATLPQLWQDEQPSSQVQCRVWGVWGLASQNLNHRRVAVRFTLEARTSQVFLHVCRLQIGSVRNPAIRNSNILYPTTLTHEPMNPEI